MSYIFTKAGHEKVKLFLDELYAKRKEILDAGKDTLNSTSVEITEDDIRDDIEFVGLDENGEYINCWGVTDHCDSAPICLKLGEDFVPGNRICVTMEKTIRVAKYYDATEDDLQCIENGENPFFEDMQHEIECTSDTADIEYDYAIYNEDIGKDMVKWS